MRKIILLLILLSFLLVLPSIKAEVGCCENTTLGFLCQEVDRTECNPAYQFSQYTCENTDFCKTGCCVSDAGCAVTTGSLCQGENATFLEGNSECTIDDCAMVCCIIGTEAIVMPQARCEKEAERANLEPVIVRTSSQEACSNLLTNEGCCKISRINKCMYTNSDVCRLNNGILNPKICSQVEGCSCTGNFRKGCHSSDINKVFNLDSCGNPESTYMNCGTGRCSEQTNGSICVSETCDDKVFGDRWCGSDYTEEDLKNETRPIIAWQEYVYTCGLNKEIQILELDAFGSQLCLENPDGKTVSVIDNDANQCFSYTDKLSCQHDSLCIWVDNFTEFRVLEAVKNYLYPSWDLYSDWQTYVRGFKDNDCLPKYPLNNNKSCSRGSVAHDATTVEGYIRTYSVAQDPFQSTAWFCNSDTHTHSRCYLGGSMRRDEDENTVDWDMNTHLFWQLNTHNFPNINPSEMLTNGNSHINPRTTGARAMNATEREAIWSTAIAKRCRQLGMCGSYENLADYRSSLTSVLKRDKYGDAGMHDRFGVDLKFDPEKNSPFSTFEGWHRGFLRQDVRVTLYSFECKEWQPPSGIEDCHVCNEQGDAMHPKPCTQLRCNSLGQNCVFNSETKECKTGQSDILPPVVASNDCWKNTSSQSNQCDISFDVQNYERMTIKLTTNEDAQCIFTDDNTNPNFGSPQFFLPSQEYLTYHEVTVSYQSEEEQDKFMDLRYLCKDEAGNEMLSPGHIYFKVKSLLTGETSLPELINTLPENNAMINAAWDKLELTVYLNEPAFCRWTIPPDKIYSDMPIENQFNATDGMGDPLMFFGRVNITIQPNMQNTILLRCNDSYGNVNPISFTLNFYPAPPLFITEIDPKDGQVIGHCKGNQQEKKLIKVKTAGGINSGVSACSWKNSSGRWIKFTDTNSNVHSTEIPIITGTNILSVRCTDSASWTTNTTTFSTVDDLEAPKIIRINGGGQLTIKTNEEATCAFNLLASCLFNASEELRSVPFSTGDKLTHTTAWKSDPWYVKCYDKCGNGNTDPNNPLIIVDLCDKIYPQTLN